MPGVGVVFWSDDAGIIESVQVVNEEADDKVHVGAAVEPTRRAYSALEAESPQLIFFSFTMRYQ